MTTGNGTTTGRHGNGATQSADTLSASIVNTRWLLAFAIGATILFGAESPTSVWPHGVFAVLVLLSNAPLVWLQRHHPDWWSQILWVVTVVDVAALMLVVALASPSMETYVAGFAVLILGMALGRLGVVTMLMFIGFGLYFAYQFNAIGWTLWNHSELLLRVPLMFSVGLYFSTVGRHLRGEKTRTHDLEIEARQFAERADHMAKERDRLQGLSEIGKLGLTGIGDADSGDVLFKVSERTRKSLGADRGSLALFAQSVRASNLARQGEGLMSDIRYLEFDPRALDKILGSDTVTEVRPGTSTQLWKDVAPFFPSANVHGSMLVAPLRLGDSYLGAFFMIYEDHNRAFAAAEKDFLWTVALMLATFLKRRYQLENEVHLRSLVRNAHAVMFTLDRDGTFTIFDGKGLAAAKLRPGDWVGSSIYETCGDTLEVRDAVEKALGGVPGTLHLAIGELVFETHLSPLRGLDGQIGGTVGIATHVKGAAVGGQTVEVA